MCCCACLLTSAVCDTAITYLLVTFFAARKFHYVRKVRRLALSAWIFV